MTPAQFASAKKAVQKASGVRSPEEMAQYLAFPKINLEGIENPEDRQKAAVQQIVEGLQSRVPGLIDQLAPWEPEKALEIYQNLLEFLVPKLARTEISGTMAHKVQMFVPVSQRESAPVELTKGPDGVYTSS